MITEYYYDLPRSYEGIMSMSPEDINDMIKAYFKEHHTLRFIVDIMVAGRFSDVEYEENVIQLWLDIIKAISLGQDPKTMTNSNSSNAVIGKLMKRGIRKEKISYNKGSFKLQLHNSTWFNSLSYSDFWISPCRSMRAMYIPCMPEASPETIADYILWFDSMLERFKVAYDNLVSTCRSRSMKVRREKMEAKLIETNLYSISNDTLSPHGISAKFSFVKGIVRSDFTILRVGVFDVSLQEAESLFADPIHMLEMMNGNESDIDTRFYTSGNKMYKWYIVPIKESSDMSKLRHLARVNLSGYGIHVVVSSKGDQEYHIEARLHILTKDYTNTFDETLKLIQEPQKVQALLMERDKYNYNFINNDS